MSYPWKPVRPRRSHEAWVAVALTAAGVSLAVSLAVALAREPEQFTLGPCTMLGLATADGLDGPHLVIDCDGTQFGVPAVMP